MRIGFFGGSFDPPHRGHVAIARCAADRLALDRVLVAPVGRQPLKDGWSQASYADRLAMVKLAFADDPRCEASDLDAPRADGQRNYTYETLAGLKREAGDELFCLLGADSFHSFAHWHRATDLVLLCDWIVATRPGYPLEELGSRLPDEVGLEGETVRDNVVEVQLASVADGRRSKLYVLADLEEDVSATALRQALASGDEALSDTMLEPAVSRYIREHGLYTTQRRSPSS